jgi:hypothetical protein
MTPERCFENIFIITCGFLMKVAQGSLKAFRQPSECLKAILSEFRRYNMGRHVVVTYVLPFSLLSW